MGSVAGDLEYQQEMPIETALCLLYIHIEHEPVVRPTSCHHHVVDLRQITEEPLERNHCGLTHVRMGDKSIFQIDGTDPFAPRT